MLTWNKTPEARVVDKLLDTLSAMSKTCKALRVDSWTVDPSLYLTVYADARSCEWTLKGGVK